MKLLEYIKNYAESNALPMHMPGHKRNTDFAQYLEVLGAEYDVTEIYGMDDLHSADGILKSCMENAKRLWKSNNSFFMVNGSTGGILAGIRSCTNYGDKILVARNCHKSVYNAIEICGLNPIYIMPEVSEKLPIYTSINPDKIKSIVEENPDIKLIVITSPTYEGVISDIRSISRISHSFNIPLMVDEAHGSHLDLSRYFQGGAIQGGADIVVQSMHKTLPCLTQTAILHLNSNLVSLSKLKRQLEIFQTSSPSYLFMSAMDCCVELIRNKKLFQQWNEKLEFFREKVKGLKNLQILNYTYYDNLYAFDNSKIVISTTNTNMNGNILMCMLREKFNIELEMCSGDYAIAMTSMADKTENYIRLAEALCEIDKNICYTKRENLCTTITEIPQFAISPLEVQSKKGEAVKLSNAVGSISAEYVWIYPPGIPVIAMGEIISAETVTILENAKNTGLNIQKTITEKTDEIMIVCD